MVSATSDWRYQGLLPQRKTTRQAGAGFLRACWEILGNGENLADKLASSIGSLPDGATRFDACGRGRKHRA